MPQTALVIDDERDIRELLSITLGRMDLQVDTASNVAEAKERLAETRYALCFTDMKLPDGSGPGNLHRADRRAALPQTPVAMITAHGNVDAAVTALKAGAFDFVSKPVDITMLRRLVQTALRLSEEKRAEPGRNGRVASHSATRPRYSCSARRSQSSRAVRRPSTSAANPASARNSSHG